MAANRSDSFATAIGRIWARGGMFGCKAPPTVLSAVDLLITK